jgi:hypothetical protein
MEKLDRGEIRSAKSRVMAIRYERSSLKSTERRMAKDSRDWSDQHSRTTRNLRCLLETGLVARTDDENPTTLTR